MKTIYDVFGELGIEYELFDHPPFFTCDESREWYEENLDLSSGESKNLLLRNKKGNVHYLVVVESTKRVDLKDLASQLEESKLSFASEERMMRTLGVKPGAVSVLALTHPGAKDVRVVFDNELMGFKKLHYHPPGRNDQTIVLKTEDLKRLMAWFGNHIQYVEL